MLSEIIRSVNWVDLVILAIFIRALFVGLKRGFIDEIFHLLATVASIFIVFHYYPHISQFFQERVLLSLGLANALGYGGLWALVAFVTKIVRDGFRLIFKVEALSWINKVGGVLIAVVQGVLVAGLAVWLIFLSGNDYAKRTVENSLVGVRCAVVVSRVYEATCVGIISKFFPREPINSEVLIGRSGRTR
jgi:uncharacterized membrane protein required for colicin V production